MSRLMICLFVWLGATAAGAAATDPSRLAGITSSPFARAPMDRTFTDQNGRRVTLGSIAGDEPLLLVPVQHGCRNLCAPTLVTLASVMARADLHPGPGFHVVAFGIDPRETPRDAAQSAGRLGAGPGVEALVGDAADVAAVTAALGYRYSWIAATRQYAHMSAIAVLSPDGRLTRWLPGFGETPQQLTRALTAARTGAPTDLGARIQLLCFHFDPATGRYTLAVWRLLQGAAGLAVLALAAAVGAAVWRERGAAT